MFPAFLQIHEFHSTMKIMKLADTILSQIKGFCSNAALLLDFHAKIRYPIIGFILLGCLDKPIS